MMGAQRARHVKKAMKLIAHAANCLGLMRLRTNEMGDTANSRYPRMSANTATAGIDWAAYIALKFKKQRATLMRVSVQVTRTFTG